MRIVPAVDIKGGRCVRLVEGDPARETTFFADPVDAARTWVEAGATIIHVVDLDGAFGGKTTAMAAARRIVALGVEVEFGGGVRDTDTIENLVKMGVTRVVIGTAAYKRPQFMEEAAERFGERVVLGLDLKEGRIAVDGWTKSIEAEPTEIARRAENVGIGRVIFTNVARDGTMSGPDLKFAAELAAGLTIPLTLSGGISSLDDIRAAKKISHLGIDEVIVGRALYEGSFSFEDAAKLAEG